MDVAWVCVLTRPQLCWGKFWFWCPPVWSEETTWLNQMWTNSRGGLLLSGLLSHECMLCSSVVALRLYYVILHLSTCNSLCSFLIIAFNPTEIICTGKDDNWLRVCVELSVITAASWRLAWKLMSQEFISVFSWKAPLWFKNFSRSECNQTNQSRPWWKRRELQSGFSCDTFKKVLQVWRQWCRQRGCCSVIGFIRAGQHFLV